MPIEWFSANEQSQTHAHGVLPCAKARANRAENVCSWSQQDPQRSTPDGSSPRRRRRRRSRRWAMSTVQCSSCSLLILPLISKKYFIKFNDLGRFSLRYNTFVNARTASLSGELHFQTHCEVDSQAVGNASLKSKRKRDHQRSAISRSFALFSFARRWDIMRAFLWLQLQRKRALAA